MSNATAARSPVKKSVRAPSGKPAAAPAHPLAPLLPSWAPLLATPLARPTAHVAHVPSGEGLPPTPSGCGFTYPAARPVYRYVPENAHLLPQWEPPSQILADKWRPVLPVEHEWLAVYRLLLLSWAEELQGHELPAALDRGGRYAVESAPRLLRHDWPGNSHGAHTWTMVAWVWWEVLNSPQRTALGRYVASHHGLEELRLTQARAALAAGSEPPDGAPLPELARLYAEHKRPVPGYLASHVAELAPAPRARGAGVKGKGQAAQPTPSRFATDEIWGVAG